MERVRNFEELPEWLRHRIAADWAMLCDGPVPSHPPIRDPEYRVYRIGDSGWWAVDAGTGGVTIESEDACHAYVDLPEGSPLRALVDREGRLWRDRENVEALYGVLRSRGADAFKLGSAMARWRTNGMDDEGVFWQLVIVLDHYKRTGDWELSA